MKNEKKAKDLFDDIGWIFGLDRLEIYRTSESTLEMKAIVSSEKTVLNYYKIFLAYINEIEKAKNDVRSLEILKMQLLKYKNAFDNNMEDTCKEIKSVFNKFKVDITLSYEGDVKTVYSTISELVN